MTALAHRQRPRGCGRGRASPASRRLPARGRSTSQARILAASMGFAAPAPCSSMASRSARASPSPPPAATPTSPPSRASMTTRSRSSCAPPSTASTRCNADSARRECWSPPAISFFAFGEPDERRIRLGLSGNLCRCTGYVGIVQAVRSVIAARRERGIAAIVADPQRGLGPIGARIGSGFATAHRTAEDRRAADCPRRPRMSLRLHADRQFRRRASLFARPPAEVFAAFGRIREIADCIPGAVVDGEAAPDRVEGGIRVRFGPISPVFRGTGPHRTG